MTDYSESSLVEQPTIELFQSLGYEHQNCFNEKLGENSERNNKKDCERSRPR
jgi:hypothetical protein